MRKKRKRASAVIVDGIVHAIGKHEPEQKFFAATDEPREASWMGALGEYPLRRSTRAQRKADKARAIRERLEPRVSLLCDAQPRMIQAWPGQTPFRMPPWRRVPRTHALVNCMACLVAGSRA